MKEFIVDAQVRYRTFAEDEADAAAMLEDIFGGEFEVIEVESIQEVVEEPQPEEAYEEGIDYAEGD